MRLLLLGGGRSIADFEEETFRGEKISSLPPVPIIPMDYRRGLKRGVVERGKVFGTSESVW